MYKLLVIDEAGNTIQIPYDTINNKIANVTFSETPPAFPHTNLFWWDEGDSGSLFIQKDGAWIAASNIRALKGKDGTNGTNGTNGANGAPGAAGVSSLAQIHAALLSFK